MELIISSVELEKIISRSTEIGFQRGMEHSGKLPRFISQNAAYKRFIKCRVIGWVENKLIEPISNGNGKTSTIFYEYAKLLQLEASEQVIVRKPYINDGIKLIDVYPPK